MKNVFLIEKNQGGAIKLIIQSKTTMLKIPIDQNISAASKITFPFNNDNKQISHLPGDELEKNKEFEVLQLIFTKLSWTHIRQILREKNSDARSYYIRETVKNTWVVETLDRNIATQYYERLFLSHAKEAVKGEIATKASNHQINKNEFFKSPAVLEFLNIPAHNTYTETELEKARS